MNRTTETAGMTRAKRLSILTSMERLTGITRMTKLAIQTRAASNSRQPRLSGMRGLDRMARLTTGRTEVTRQA